MLAKAFNVRWLHEPYLYIENRNIFQANDTAACFRIHKIEDLGSQSEKYSDKIQRRNIENKGKIYRKKYTIIVQNKQKVKL